MFRLCELPLCKGLLDPSDSYAETPAQTVDYLYVMVNEGLIRLKSSTHLPV